MKRLEEKVAIVTGGATGIGEAISKKFAREGARVLVAGLEADPVEKVVQEIRANGGEAESCMLDISNEDNAKTCVQLALGHWNKLDILINNAGVFPQVATTEEFSTDAFDNLIKNNVRSAFFMTKHALPHLQKTQGCIVSAGSESGNLGLAQATAYGGTKGFIHAFMRGVAVEQAKHGVRANCVCPGPIDTAWTHKETSGMDRKMEKQMVAATPMGRRGTTEEIANVYLFLASQEASYVTGALFYADGGITVAKGNVGEEVPNKLRKAPKGELELHHEHEGATELR